MGGGRRRLTRADLEAMLGEFDIVERYGGAASTVDNDLHQIRGNARMGVSLEEWARARRVPLAYARALRLFSLALAKIRDLGDAPSFPNVHHTGT